jgi:hypothetical protein
MGIAIAENQAPNTKFPSCPTYPRISRAEGDREVDGGCSQDLPLDVQKCPFHGVSNDKLGAIELEVSQLDFQTISIRKLRSRVCLSSAASRTGKSQSRSAGGEGEHDSSPQTPIVSTSTCFNRLPCSPDNSPEN